MHCFKCKLKVVHVNGVLVKACTCDAAIVAEIKGTAAGSGGLQKKK